MEQDSKKLTLRSSFLWVLCSTIAISATAWGGWFSYLKWDQMRKESTEYPILKIVSQNRKIPVLVLAETLEIEGKNLYSFNLKKGEMRLLSIPCLETATIERRPPDTIVVDYKTRTPFAIVGDYFVDKEGFLFEKKYYSSQPLLCSLVLSGTPEMKQKQFDLAKTVLEEFPRLEVIDVRWAYEDTLGRRQVIVVGHFGDRLRVVRVNEKDWKEKIFSMEKISTELHESFKIIDFRSKNFLIADK